MAGAGRVRTPPEFGNWMVEARPLVALESSVFAQGLPIPANRTAARTMRGAIDSRGAVPLITGIVKGTPAVGLTEDELERFLARDGIEKVSARDLASAMARGADGATTVAAAILLAHNAGVEVLATGGIGGVHRAPAYDESADLAELARTSIIVVCSGPKAILDLRATSERLDSLGVTIVGFGTDEMPAFYGAESGIPVERVNEPSMIASIFKAKRDLGQSGALLVVQPPPPQYALPASVVERAVVEGIRESTRAGIQGSAITPFLLAYVDKATGGRAREVNLALLEQNAALAASIAVEMVRFALR